MKRVRYVKRAPAIRNKQTKAITTKKSKKGTKESKQGEREKIQNKTKQISEHPFFFSYFLTLFFSTSGQVNVIVRFVMRQENYKEEEKTYVFKRKH